MCTIYALRCQDKIKIGFTDQPFAQYLTWIRARIPFEVVPLATRRGTKEQEQEFHRSHRDFQCGFGGREWYNDSPVFRREVELFMSELPAQGSVQ